MLSHQRWPYVGRFARGWHRLPGRIPGQPQTRTRAHPRIGSIDPSAQRVPLRQGARGRDSVDIGRARIEEGRRRGSERRSGREDVVDEQDTRRRCADGSERTRHRGPAFGGRPASLRRGIDRAQQQAPRGSVDPSAERHGQRAGLVVPTLGATPARQGDPCHDVHRRQVVDGRHRPGERRRDVAPPREFQPVDRSSRGPRVDERRTRRAERRRRTVIAPIERRGRRRPAPAAPRRTKRLQRSDARRAEGPRAAAAPGTHMREQRVERPRPHRRTVSVGTDTGTRAA
jgi:hypothetical protein